MIKTAMKVGTIAAFLMIVSLAFADSPATTTDAAAIVAAGATTSVTVTPAGAVNPANVISLAPLVSLAVQVLGAVILAFISVFIIPVMQSIAKRMNVTVDQTMLDRAKSAALTAAGSIIAQAGNTAAVKNASFTVNSPEIVREANIALAKIPDAEAKLGLTQNKMNELVLGEMGKLQAAGTAPASDPPKPI